MIDLDFIVVNYFLIGALGEEVVVALIRIENIYGRHWVEVEYLLRDRADQIRGDGGIRKCLPGKRITDRPIIRPGTASITVTIVIGKTREVTVARSRRW